MNKFFTTILLLFSCSFASAQINFDELNGPPGGRVLKLESNASGTVLYALVSPNNDDLGIVYVEDGAGYWKRAKNINQGTIIDIAVAANDDLYALESNTIWRSSNQGFSWVSTNTGSQVFSAGQKLMISASGSIIVNKSSALVASFTGSTWTDLYTASSKPITDFTIDGNAIYIGVTNSNNIFKANSVGASFSPVMSGLTTFGNVSKLLATNGKIYLLLVKDNATGGSAGGLYELTSGGTTWSSVAAGTDLSPLDFDRNATDYKLFGSKTTPGRVYVQVYSQIMYKNTPSTGSWDQLDNTYFFDNATSMVDVNNEIYIGYSETGIHRTEDEGANWGYFDDGINHANTNDFERADNDNFIVANGRSVVLVSSTLGSSWTRKSVCSNCSISSLHKLSNGDILALGSAIYISADHGLTWTFVANSPTDKNFRAVAGIDDSKIWALGTGFGTEYEIYLSEDEGVTWNLQSFTGLPGVSYRVGDLVVTGDGDLIIETSYTSFPHTRGYYKIADGSTVATGYTIPSMDRIQFLRAAGDSLYAIADDGSGGNYICFSEDNGANWDAVEIDNEAFGTANTFYVHNRDVIFIAHAYDDEQAPYQTFYYTTDGGVTWGTEYTGFYKQTLQHAEVFENGIAYVVRNGGPMTASNISILKPDKPTNVRSAGTGSDDVYIQWDYSGQTVLEFSLERRGPSDLDFVTILTDSAENDPESTKRYFLDRWAEEGTSYIYRIAAENHAGVTYSDELVVVTETPCVGNIPDNRSWTGQITSGPSNSSINIRKVNGDQYLISNLNAGDNAGVGLPGVVAGTFFQNCSEPFIGDGDAQSSGGDDTQYLIPNGNGTWNGTNQLVLKWQVNPDVNPVTTRTLTLTLNASDPAPDIPSGVYAFASSDSEIEVRWSAGSYQHKYYVERATAIAGPYTPVGSVTYPELSLTDAGPFTTSTIYYYRVKAENADSPTPDASSYSTPIFVTFKKPNFVMSETTVSSTISNALAVGWNDLDNDSDQDLVLSGFGVKGVYDQEVLFFKNDGAGDFDLVTGLVPPGSYSGSVFGDYDNDGLTDIFFPFAAAGEDGVRAAIPNVLLNNNGSFSFTNVTSSLPSQPVANDTVAAPGANWVDTDKNGILDLFIAYGDENQKLFLGSESGDFTEKTGDPLLDDPNGIQYAVWSDYDLDGEQDVFVVVPEQHGPNRLYKNTGGAFTQTNTSVFNADTGMKFTSAAWGNYDNDNDMDLYVCVQGGANLLYKNNGGTFVKQAVVANSPTENKTSISFSANWGDVDNDGDLDLLVINVAGTPSVLYLNTGTGSFTKAGDEFINKYLPQYTIGSAFADYDNDGRLDVVIGEAVNLGGNDDPMAPRSIKLLRNNNTNGNFLKINLVGNVSNRSGIGAMIYVTAGGKTQLREVQSGNSLGSYNSLQAHFGLGTATTANIEIYWPFGLVQEMTNVTVNQTITIVEDGQAPAITSLNPTNGASSVSVSTTLDITFNETPYPQAGKKIGLYESYDLVNPVEEFDVTDGVITGNTISFTPTEPLLSYNDYTVKIQDDAFFDLYGNSHQGSSVTWEFTTTDLVLPEVTFVETSVTAPGVGFGTLPLSVTATDNLTVSSVTLNYRGIGETTTFSTLAGTADAENDTNFKWNFTVPESFFNTEGLEFFFTANDPDGNTGRAPLAESTYYQIVFETVVPNITEHTPHEPVPVGFGSYDLSVTATDNKSVASVIMSYRGVGETDYNELNGTLSGGSWNFEVLEDFFTVEGLEYFFTAADPSGNETRLPAGAETFTTTFETEAPAITHTPFSGFVAKNFINKKISASVTDNFSVNSVKMYYKNSSEAGDYQFKTGTLVAGSYDFDVVLADFNNVGLLYYFEATDGTGNLARSPEGTNTYSLMLDNTAPSMSFDAAQHVDKVKGFGTTTLEITGITDNVDENCSITISYRAKSKKDYATVTKTTVAGEVEFAIEEAFFDANGLEYFIQATDVSGNIKRLPEGVNTFQMRLKWPAGTASIDLAKGNTEASGYRIISIPYILPDNRISANFDELGGANNTKYRFLRYSEGPPRRWDEYPGNLTTINRGEGYFINTTQEFKIALTEAFTPDNTQNNPFTMDLKQGWNQIGNPYTTALNWLDVQEANPTHAVEDLLTYNSSGYGNADVLNPFTGGFVHSDVAITGLVIPYQVTGGRGKSSVVSSDLGESSWQVSLRLKQGEIVNELTGFGMDPLAGLSKDKFDGVTPPRFFKYIEMATDHPEYFEKHLSRDIVPTQDEFMWEFNVTSNLEETVSLSWDNTLFGSNAKELYLIDENLQQKIDMRTQNIYYFSPQVSKKIRIYFGEELDSKIRPAGINLSKAYPNPVTKETTISFTLPEQESSYHVMLEVYNNMGQKVATLVKGTLAPGFYNALWNAKDETLISGMYTYRLQVEGSKERQIRNGKLILIK